MFTFVNDTRSWVKLADLTPTKDHRILSIRPRYRTYLRQSDAGYDWASGHPFVVTSDSSVYKGCIVAVDETRHLKDIGYTHVHIHYNTNAPHLEIAL
jgi:hypothetical protein